MLTLNDPWKHLRKDCFGNQEPEVTLEAVTAPIELFEKQIDNAQLWSSVETMPAWSAAISYGSREKLAGDRNKQISLNRKLIELGHHTPLESIQFNFHVAGISKACGAQLSRHRIGQGHVSSSRRFQSQGMSFVYPLLAYIRNEAEAAAALKVISDVNQKAFEVYEKLREEAKLHKEDARRIIPVASSQERIWWVNARALRDFFRLRLPRDAEWEIRRLAIMIFNIVNGVAPSLFEDVIVKD
ncbi:MAG: FAD-dependent thymidylate synthase [Desulfomonilaceae bacterium]